MWFERLFKRKKKIETKLPKPCELTVEVRMVGHDEFLGIMQQMGKAVDSLTEKFADLDAKVGTVCKQLSVTNNYHLSIREEKDGNSSVQSSEIETEVHQST